jgi:hypothetical protein
MEQINWSMQILSGAIFSDETLFLVKEGPLVWVCPLQRKYSEGTVYFIPISWVPDNITSTSSLSMQIFVKFFPQNLEYII